jgi:hypothetical protein
MNENKRPGSKAAQNAKTDELVADLKAIRDQVASKKTASTSPAELADLQQRLFEVWVAEKLSIGACWQEQSALELQTLKLDVTEMRKELVAAQKDVLRLGKLTEKLTAKIASLKPASRKK